MRRRVFIAFLGSVVAAWPRVARGQQSAGMRHIGVLVGNASSVDDQLGQKELQPFQDALRQAGWIEGKTIQIDYRYGAGDPAKIETAAAELVRLAPNVIYAISLKAVQAVSQEDTRGGFAKLAAIRRASSRRALGDCSASDLRPNLPRGVPGDKIHHPRSD